MRQAHRFDLDGEYVRTYVPELRHIAAPAVDNPWEYGPIAGHPPPLAAYRPHSGKTSRRPLAQGQHLWEARRVTQGGRRPVR
ncbi:FAD-binding domain-containing protein [Streptomyces sp. NPDC048825]|uniref:FAD-binding domain-containing protein n=1 Tax=Streptomyces sp. NPDC048825 TaxID=3365592 RepID=UPI00371792FC